MADAKAPAAKAAEKSPAKEPATMNLFQKFAELRRACPSIIKKQHSDGVKYTFAKIFDVYELLAPAMNAFGVDWDIINEEATKHDDRGDPVFFSSYIQHTKNGDRVVWVYEADLTLIWINCGNPQETQTIKLHAVGTNDGGPDKAKGSAWTYCLKYYLFEKFNIDQGEDDPDNYDHSSDAPQRQGNQQQRPQQQTGARGSGAGSQKPATLSDAQMVRLYKKAEAVGMTQETCNARIKAKYGHENPANMTRQQYDEICAALDNAAAAKKGQGGDENAQ